VTHVPQVIPPQSVAHVPHRVLHVSQVATQVNWPQSVWHVPQRVSHVPHLVASAVGWQPK
jgi:hypothetical protein